MDFGRSSNLNSNQFKKKVMELVARVSTDTYFASLKRIKLFRDNIKHGYMLNGNKWDIRSKGIC